MLQRLDDNSLYPFKDWRNPLNLLKLRDSSSRYGQIEDFEKLVYKSRWTLNRRTLMPSIPENFFMSNEWVKNFTNLLRNNSFKTKWWRFCISFGSIIIRKFSNKIYKIIMSLIVWAISLSLLRNSNDNAMIKTSNTLKERFNFFVTILYIFKKYFFHT